VVIPVIASGANGEAQGWLVLIFDLPLVIVLMGFDEMVRLPRWILATGPLLYYFVVGVLGTLMCAGVGALIGRLIDRRLSKIRAAR
jgi:hypothetical protein